MTLLESITTDKLSRKAWAEHSIADLHLQIQDALKHNTSPEVAAMFARPAPDPDGHVVDYSVPNGANAVRYIDLSDDEQADIRAQIKDAMAEVDAMRERFASDDHSGEKALSPEKKAKERNVAELLRLVSIIPSEEHIWSVDGRPVITVWGFGGPDSEIDLRSLSGKRPDTPVTWWQRMKRRIIAVIVALLLLLLGWLLFWFEVPCKLGLVSCHEPVAEADFGTLPWPDESVTLDVIANDMDPDGDILKLVSCDSPGRALDERRVILSRTEGLADPTSFDCTIADTSGNEVSAPVTITVEGRPNRAPEGGPVRGQISPHENDIVLPLLASVTDPDGDAVELRSCTAPLTVTGQSVRAERSGSGSAEIIRGRCTVADDRGATAQIEVEIDMAAPHENKRPLSRQLRVTLPAGKPSIAIDVLSAANDPEGEPLSLESCTPTLPVSGGKVTYSRPTDGRQSDYFTCTVADPQGATGDVPVIVDIPAPIQNCDPISETASVLLVIGLDTSSTMENGNRLSTAKNALAALLVSGDSRELPKNVDISLISWSDSSAETIYDGKNRTTILNRISSLSARTGDATSQYREALASHLDKVAANYDIVSVITITDLEVKIDGRIQSILDQDNDKFDLNYINFGDDELGSRALISQRNDPIRLESGNFATEFADSLGQAVRLVPREGCPQQ